MSFSQFYANINSLRLIMNLQYQIMSRHWNEDETEWSSLFVQKKKDFNLLFKNHL